MDRRIESFLGDVLALAGEEPDAVREGVRVALAKCEAIFRLQGRSLGLEATRGSWPTRRARTVVGNGSAAEAAANQLGSSPPLASC
jgi:hypothetical protein